MENYLEKNCSEKATAIGCYRWKIKINSICSLLEVGCPTPSQRYRNCCNSYPKWNLLLTENSVESHVTFLWAHGLSLAIPAWLQTLQHRSFLKGRSVCYLTGSVCPLFYRWLDAPLWNASPRLFAWCEICLTFWNMSNSLHMNII